MDRRGRVVDEFEALVTTPVTDAREEVRALGTDRFPGIGRASRITIRRTSWSRPISLNAIRPRVRTSSWASVTGVATSASSSSTTRPRRSTAASSRASLLAKCL